MWTMRGVVGYGQCLQAADEEGLWRPGCNNGLAELCGVLAGPIRPDIHGTSRDSDIGNRV